MSACTFFGHSNCYGLDAEVLRQTLTQLVAQGVDTFYVGNHGDFDRMVFSCLKKMKSIYPHIYISVVLAYLPEKKVEYDPYDGYSMYPELEKGPLRFAIDRRNKWMINASDWCVVKVDHTFGGANKFAKIAKRHGLRIINLGSVEL